MSTLFALFLDDFFVSPLELKVYIHFLGAYELSN